MGIFLVARAVAIKGRGVARARDAFRAPASLGTAMLEGGVLEADAGPTFARASRRSAMWEAAAFKGLGEGVGALICEVDVDSWMVGCRPARFGKFLKGALSISLGT